MLAGEQIRQISGVHVEPALLGDGGCSYYGHCSGQRRGSAQTSTFISMFLFSFSFLIKNV
jgi:hypothetical protein